MILKNQIAAIVLTLAFVAVASPTFAQTNALHVSAARAAAIHESNVRAARFTLYTWGNFQLYVYRAYPWERRRNAVADIEVFRSWAKALREEGVAIGQLDLSLEERTALRVTAQELRRQEHREAIAVQALAEFREKPEEFRGSDQSMDLEWLDRFWRLAEDVSNADFQSIWGRILARHAAGGTSYSARCLHTLSTLSRSEAEILERLAAVTVQPVLRGQPQSHCVLHRIGEYFYGPNVRQSPTDLQQLNQKLSQVVGPLQADVLGPSGIYVESGWAHEAYLSVADSKAQFSIGSVWYRIAGFSHPLAHSAMQAEEAVNLGSGMRFSPVGAEIIGLIRTTPAPAFVSIVGQILELYGLSLSS